MKKLLCVVAVILVSACGTTFNSNKVIDPSLAADPICQPKFGMPGCYSGGGE